MQQAPPEGRRDEQRPPVDEHRDDEQRTLKEAVEAAASAYFSACRKLARAINRLKER